MSNVVSRCTLTLFRRSLAGVFAARRCIARSPYGVEGAPAPLLRGVRREAERLAEGVAVARRLGVMGLRLWEGRRWSCYSSEIASV